MIAGEPFDHRLYHYRLAFPGFEHAHVVLGGESFAALAEGCRMRCVRWAARRNKTAATACRRRSRNLDRVAQDDLTRRYEALCAITA